MAVVAAAIVPISISAMMMVAIVIVMVHPVAIVVVTIVRRWGGAPVMLDDRWSRDEIRRGNDHRRWRKTDQAGVADADRDIGCGWQTEGGGEKGDGGEEAFHCRFPDWLW